MLNNKGWGLGAFIGFSLVFIFFIILASVNAYKIGINKEKPNLQFEDTQHNYVNLENNLLEGGKRYFKTHKKEIIVTSDTLIKNKYMGYLNDHNYTKCTGYVKNYSNDTYKAFMRCGSSYTTSGYDIDLDK